MLSKYSLAASKGNAHRNATKNAYEVNIQYIMCLSLSA